MTVVCNSTVLIALSRIGKLHILKEVFNEVIVPDAVYDEVVSGGKGKPGAQDVEKAAWIKKKSIKDALAAKVLKTDMGEGEAEAIILAQELNAAYAVIDEQARKHAELLGLNVIGTLGVLAFAYRRGILPDFKETLGALIESGFYIKQELHKKILKDMGFI